MLRTTTLVLALSGALLIGGCADTEEIDSKPAATVEKPAEAPKAEATQAGEKPAAAPEAGVKDPAEIQSPEGQRWAADTSKSSIGFLGAKVTNTHKGGFTGFSGQAVTNEAGKLSFVRFVVQTSTLWADEKNPAEGTGPFKLTGHLKSPDFFDVAKYPTADFASTKIEHGEGNAATVTGNLKFHGVTKTISFPATIESTADAIQAKAEFKINRKDWGLTYPGKPDDLIKDEVALTLDFTFVK